MPTSEIRCSYQRSYSWFSWGSSSGIRGSLPPASWHICIQPDSQDGMRVKISDDDSETFGRSTDGVFDVGCRGCALGIDRIIRRLVSTFPQPATRAVMLPGGSTVGTSGRPRSFG